MTLSLPTDEMRARIVCQITERVEHLQLRHVPSDWLIVSMSRGSDITATVDRLRRVAERRGYVVGDGMTVEDWNQRIAAMNPSWRRPLIPPHQRRASRSPGRAKL
jgi:hypothetical protein